MATTEVDPAIKELGDKMVSLTVLQAKSLADYLESAYGIKPAAGGVVVAAGGAGGGGGEAAKPAEKTEFDVILSSFGENKMGVIKVVRQLISGLGLKEAKDLVESAPKPLKQGIAKDEAEKIKKEIEGAGGTCEIK